MKKLTEQEIKENRNMMTHCPYCSKKFDYYNKETGLWGCDTCPADQDFINDLEQECAKDNYRVIVTNCYDEELLTTDYYFDTLEEAEENFEELMDEDYLLEASLMAYGKVIRTVERYV